jgi:hypothetical protein
MRVRFPREAAAVLDEQLEGARPSVVRPPGLEAVAVVDEQFGLVLGVGRVVFSPARGEGLAVVGEGRGVDRVKDEEVVLEEGEDERAARLLEADGDLAAREAGPEPGGPLLDRLRAVIEDGELAAVRGVLEEAEVVLGVGPVDPDVGGEVVHGVTPERGRLVDEGAKQAGPGSAKDL